MRLKSQYVVIVAIVGVLLLFFGINMLFGGDKAANAKAPAAPSGPPSVQVKLTPPTMAMMTTYCDFKRIKLYPRSQLRAPWSPPHAGAVVSRLALLVMPPLCQRK